VNHLPPAAIAAQLCEMYSMCAPPSHASDLGMLVHDSAMARYLYDHKLAEIRPGVEWPREGQPSYIYMHLAERGKNAVLETLATLEQCL
jgi:hypothetical protein